jgi:D-methionine transport system permease protein
MITSELSLALELLPQATLDTIYMTIVSTFFAVLLGLPLGIILYLTGKGRRKDCPLVYKSLSSLVNIGRSFPFAILMIALIPFTRWIVGTSLGTTAAIVPLSLAAAPFFARSVEHSLAQIDIHIIEAVELMGASTMQIIYKVLIKEPLPGLISSLGNTAINLVGYSAMAGLVGGGGLGKVAIQYGYNQFNIAVMVSTVAILILLVEGLQALSNAVSHSLLKKRGIISHE